MVNHTVLVVEDDRITALDLKNSLEQLGVKVLDLAARGEEALRLAADADVVLMDIRLDGAMSGIEAAAAIRREHGIPVVFLTVLTDMEILRQALAVEPAGYLVKPFETVELRSTLEIALTRHAAERALRESRASLQALIDNAPGALFVLQNGECRLANAACARLYGCDPAEPPSLGLLAMVHKEHRPAVDELLSASAPGAAGQLQPWRRTLLFVDTAGREFWCDMSAAPFTFEGRPALACMAMDLPGRG